MPAKSCSKPTSQRSYYRKATSTRSWLYGKALGNHCEIETQAIVGSMNFMLVLGQMLELCAKGGAKAEEEEEEANYF
jgi:hypothetical protein